MKKVGRFLEKKRLLHCKIYRKQAIVSGNLRRFSIFTGVATMICSGKKRNLFINCGNTVGGSFVA